MINLDIYKMEKEYPKKITRFKSALTCGTPDKENHESLLRNPKDDYILLEEAQEAVRKAIRCKTTKNMVEILLEKFHLKNF